MLTMEQLGGLAAGDVVEVPSLMAGLSDEPVKLRVKYAGADHAEWLFTATWIGVTLGTWSCQAGSGEPKWSFR